MRICPHCRTEYGPEQEICPNDGARLTDHAPADDALIGKLLADRYRVIRVLGEGGMGRVYLAEHVRMGRMSAVKVMSPALAPTADAIARFNREAANASRINHPNVAAIYDFGETADGTLYLAMEFIAGETLTSLVAREGPLAIPRAAALTSQIAAALHAAHQLGIVHRDLKPDNILVARDAENAEWVKVVDFGIAKTTRGGGQTLTTVGMSIGTPEYMSPEQLAGEALDARSDLYSLGLVLFNMLTGALPYPDMSSKQSLVQRLTTRPRPLVEVRPSTAWPPPLQSALDKALSPEPGDRYARVLDFARDVVSAAETPRPIDQIPTRAMTPLGLRAIPETVPTNPVAVARPSRAPLFVALGAVVVFAAVAVWRFSAGPASSGVHATQPLVRADSSAQVAAAFPPAESSKTTPKDTPFVAKSTKRDTAGARGATVVVPSERSESRDLHLGSAATKSLTTTPPNIADAPKPAPIDSTPAPTSVTPDAATRPRRAGSHPWLRANGDSALTPLSGPSPIADEAREVMGHITRARLMFSRHQPAKAAPELRTAMDEYQIFALEHPGTRETTMVGQQLFATVQGALAECRAARDSSTVQGRRAAMCDGLEKAAAHAAQLRGGPPLGPFRNRRGVPPRVDRN